MSNLTNKKQIEILIQRMRENQSLAGGYTKESKESVTAFWKKLNLELNSYGPPMKSTMEWKKVWTDQKRYVRKKAAENVKQRDGTGGGPYKIKMLNPTEEAIYDIVHMKESVEGVENASVFGLPKNKENECSDQEVHLDIQNDVSNITDIQPTHSSAKKRKCDNIFEKAGVRESLPAIPDKTQTLQLIEKEVKTQENLCNKVSELVEFVKEGNCEKNELLKRMSRALEKLNDIQKNKIKEIERHNNIMEQYRKKEVESKLTKNKKLIEIEELKLELMRKS